MNNKTFISFEGCEGSGKTTVISKIKKLLCQKLDYSEDKILITREPGGVTISENIRNIILDNNNSNMDERTEAILYAASRRQHLIEKIIPALKTKKIILCDRFLDSSLAYQGVARGIGIDEVLQLNNFAIDKLIPSLTIYLDIEPLVGLKRIDLANLKKNRLDNEDIYFHNQVRKGYLMLLKKWPNRIFKINAEQSIDKVVNDALNVILKHFNYE